MRPQTFNSFREGHHMKKLLTLLLAAGMIVSAYQPASAVDMKVSGEWLVGFHVTDNLYGVNALQKDNADGDAHFKADQRIRINFDLIAGEYLSGHVQLQVGNGTTMPHAYEYGSNSVGGPGKEVTARLAYLDWLIPGTETQVRMGRQPWNAPSYTFGSPVFGTPTAVDAVMLNAPVNDMVAFNAGWLRTSAQMEKWGVAHTAHRSVDLAYLSADVAGEGFKFTPWGIVGLHGNKAPNQDMLGYGTDTNPRTTVYWAGLGGELSLFDPFRFTADFIYSGNDADGKAKRSGWYAALGAEMKTGFGTPFVKGWYASGDDADSDKSGRMMSIGRSGIFDAASLYFDGLGMLAQPIDNTTPAGTWGVQLGVKGVSFMQDLTHMLYATYIQGTNNTNRITNTTLKNELLSADATLLLQGANPARYMTTSDSLWELNLMNRYSLYKNLSAYLMLSYMITDFDENIRPERYDNGFRGSLMFSYLF